MTKKTIKPLKDHVAKTAKNQRAFAQSINQFDAKVGYWCKQGWHIDAQGGLWSYRGNINERVEK